MAIWPKSPRILSNIMVEGLGTSYQSVNLTQYLIYMQWSLNITGEHEFE